MAGNGSSSLRAQIDGVLKLADIASNFDPTGISGAAVSGVQWIQEFVLKLREQRISEFHRELLREYENDPGLSDAQIEKVDFHALLSACVADIEDEKTTAFAALARSIAHGRVDAENRRHFILSLRDISFDQLDFARLLYVKTKYRLVPSQGSGEQTVQQELKDIRVGTIKHLAYGALNSRGFVEPNKLTPMGLSEPPRVSRRLHLLRNWSHYAKAT